jgi:hypothetical protein
LIIGIYLDECLVIRKEMSISKFIGDLKGHELKLEVEKNLVDYLSFQVVKSKNEN